MLKRGKLFNANITSQDYRNAIQIYGKDLGDIKGKTTQKTPDHIPVNVLEKPKAINLTLSVDVMYFTGMMFLTTVSRNVHFITASLLENRRKQTILREIQKNFNIYKGKGHEVNNIKFFDTKDTPIHTLLVDNEFQSIKEKIEENGVQVHVVTKNEHVPEVECQNRVIKEISRAIIQTLPNTDLPRKIRIALIKYVVFWLNNTLEENQYMTRREMIMGE